MQEFNIVQPYNSMLLKLAAPYEDSNFWVSLMASFPESYQYHLKAHSNFPTPFLVTTVQCPAICHCHSLRAFI